MTIDRSHWKLSIIVSMLLSFILIALWVWLNVHEQERPQLVDHDSAQAKLNKFQESNINTIKTGIHLQSLQFLSSSDVNLAGYIWQKYYCDNAAQLTKDSNPNECINKITPLPTAEQVGFILPEQVNSGSDISPIEKYRKLEKSGEYVVIGWYFEATLRQDFDYYSYPFDHKTVWVRMWPTEFSKNVALVPDYDAYDSTRQEDIFGIEEDMVLGTWERQDTYFDYKFSRYNTNFGIYDYVGKSNFPEMSYNVVLKRKFGNAFIIYLLPLFLVAILLFAAVLTVTDDKQISDKIGFNASGFMGAASALFFVVMLAHVQLREQFSGAGIVYIEGFYILMYFLLVLATTNTYLFARRSNILGGLLLQHDNLVAKILFWPITIGAMIIITIPVLIKSVFY